MATQVPIPSFKIGGAQALVVFLFVVATFGALHLLAISKPDWKWSKAWTGGLGF